jgi:DNA primase
MRLGVRDRELLELVDPEEMLQELGVQNVKDVGGEIQFSCPFPGHSHMDSTPSAYMTRESRDAPDGGEFPPTTFHCFTCGMKGTAITFVSEYEGVSPIVAKRFLKERFAPGYIPPNRKISDVVKEILDKKNKPKVSREPKFLDQSEVDSRALDWEAADEIRMGSMEEQLRVPIPMLYMLGRGFHPAVLQAFEIGFDPISSRISIPVRNHEGNLVGFKGRAWWDTHPKYLVLGGDEYGFEPYEASRYLFALNLARFEGDTIIVREGELNAIAMHQKGWRNTVGVPTKRLSTRHILLLKTFAERAIVYFDDREDSERAARDLTPYMPVKIAYSENDPADATPDEVEGAIKSATRLHPTKLLT